ncbi:MAG: hypothetical protein JWP97_3507 [Labilithrix sp.]|nr:hypothetical protein [Labilithrix sp.]
MTSRSGDENKKGGDRALGVTLIAIGKLIKVTLLVVAGVAALVMAHRDAPQTLGHWAILAHVSPGNHHLHQLIAKVAGISTHHLEALGVGSFVYAAVFATEGLGLWLQKKWAEYLTVVVTLSFIPIEIYEIAHHVSALRVTTLLLNIAALVYLVVRLVRQRGKSHGKTSDRAARQRLPLSSTPIASIPSSLAAARAVPRPQNGSTMVEAPTSSRR